MTPSAMMSQRTMPPKMFTSTARTRELERISSKAAVTRSLVAPPPTSRKFAGCAAVQLDQVHGRHGKARAVHHAGDVTVEGDVVEVVLAGAPLHRIFLAWHRAAAASSGWRKSALASTLILASSAISVPALVTISGFTSTQAQVLLDVQPVERRRERLELARSACR